MKPDLGPHVCTPLKCPPSPKVTGAHSDVRRFGLEQLRASRKCQLDGLSLRMSFAEDRHSARDGSRPIAPSSEG